MTNEQKVYIRDHWQHMTDAEIGEELSLRRATVRYWRNKMGLYHYRWIGKEKEDYVRQHYADERTKNIAEHLDVSINRVYSIAKRLGVKKSEAYMERYLEESGEVLKKAGRETRYKMGHDTWNAGMKGWCAEGCEKTWYKKGFDPQNTLYNGAVTVRYDKSGDRPYLYIRVAKAQWMLYHHYVWERDNGPLADGEIIRFRDGNSLNCTPGNLQKITRAENARLNHNPEKAIESLKKYWEDHGHPATKLSDNYVAGLMAGGDHDLRDWIIENRPDIVELARKNYKLQRKIRTKEANETNNEKEEQTC